MAAVAKIEGLTETLDALNELDRRVQKSTIRKATRAGAKVMLVASKNAAPVQSGITRANVKIRSGGTKSKTGTYSLTVGVGAKDFTGQAFYAGFVLYGHKVGSRKLGDARKAVPANNWLERSFDGSKEAAAQQMIDALTAGVEGASSE